MHAVKPYRMSDSVVVKLIRRPFTSGKRAPVSTEKDAEWTPQSIRNPWGKKLLPQPGNEPSFSCQTHNLVTMPTTLSRLFMLGSNRGAMN